jgi:hypothetical protein
MHRVNELVQSIVELSPIPNDDDPALTVDLVRRYCEAAEELHMILKSTGVTSRDAWIIAPLVASFGIGTAYGCAWSVVGTLECFPAHLLRPALRDALRDRRPGARYWSAFMLGRQRDIADGSLLITALRDPEPQVRCRVLDALSMIGDVSSKPAIEQLLRDPVPEVRACAKECLEALTSQRYVSRHG